MLFLKRHITFLKVASVGLLLLSVLAFLPFALNAGGPTTQAHAAAADNRGATFWPGWALSGNQYLLSPGREFQMIMQVDGNLVLYRLGNGVEWSSNTWGHPGAWAVLQYDGNLVVYIGSNNGNKTPLWASNTSGYNVAYASMQDDGNFVLYSTNHAAPWATNTYVHTASNGLQVYFTINHRSCGGINTLGMVTITGQNQNGRSARWIGYPTGLNVFVANWWWVGIIHITYNNGANYANAYVPRQTQSDYPYSDTGFVLVTCAGTQKHLDDVVTKSDGYYWACVTRGNPVGHITYYKHWSGYAYAPNGYGSGPRGESIPYDVTGTVTIPECG